MNPLRQFVDAASKFLPAGAQEFIKKNLSATQPRHEDLEAEMLSYRPSAETSKTNRLDRLMQFVGIGDHDRQKIRQDLKQAYDGVRAEFTKAKLKIADRSTFTKWQASKMTTVLDHPKFDAYVKNQDEAEAKLNKEGVQLTEGDFILYRPDKNASKAILAYVDHNNNIQQTEINVNDSGQFSTKDRSGITNFITEKNHLTAVIQSKIHNYQEPPPATIKDVKEGFVQAGKEIVFKARQAVMTEEAKTMKKEFENGKTDEDEKLFEPDPQKALASIPDHGNFVFTNDKSDPSKVILLMRDGANVLNIPIQIHSGGFCEMEVQEKSSDGSINYKIQSGLNFQAVLANALERAKSISSTGYGSL